MHLVSDKPVSRQEFLPMISGCEGLRAPTLTDFAEGCARSPVRPPRIALTARNCSFSGQSASLESVRFNLVFHGGHLSGCRSSHIVSDPVALLWGTFRLAALKMDQPSNMNTLSNRPTSKKIMADSTLLSGGCYMLGPSCLVPHPVQLASCCTHVHTIHSSSHRN